jgi:hypothetical protein
MNSIYPTIPAASSFDSKYINIEIVVKAYNRVEPFEFYTKTGHIEIEKARSMVRVMMRQFPREYFKVDVYKVDTHLRSMDAGTFVNSK